MDHQIAVIGTGFSGMGMAIKLKQAGIDDFVVLEREDEVGGTWWVNTYPGCQCDIPSHLYSFSFAMNPDWSRTYSKQREIWEYMRRVAEEQDILPHVRFNHDVTAASWDDDEQLWVLDTNQGQIRARILVAGPGGLSEPSIPPIPGLESFEGAVFHSARWDHDHDLTGERVAVIGTGASAIQFVPQIQPKVSKLQIFQRTPPWVLPHSDRPITDVERRLFRRFPALQRTVRTAVYWMRESIAYPMTRRRAWLKVLEKVARRHMRKQVPDPELRAKLEPSYLIGCKRILPSNEWYPALTKPNVEVVTQGIEEVRSGSIVTADGEERQIDAIVLGTGFHVSDIQAAKYIRGREGKALSEVWDPSPLAYLGTAVSGFPNLFFLTGPNTGLGHNSMVYMIESQLTYVLDAIKQMRARAATSAEVRPEVQEAYNEELQARMPETVWAAGGCSSWYQDPTGRISVLWPDFTFKFRRRTERFRPEEYVLRTGTPEREPLAA